LHVQNLAVASEIEAWTKKPDEATPALRLNHIEVDRAQVDFRHTEVALVEPMSASPISFSGWFLSERLDVNDIEDRVQSDFDLFSNMRIKYTIQSIVNNAKTIVPPGGSDRYGSNAVYGAYVYPHLFTAGSDQTGDYVGVGVNMYNQVGATDTVSNTYAFKPTFTHLGGGGTGTLQHLKNAI